MLQQVRRKGRQSGDTNTNEGHNTSLSTSGDRNPRLQAKQRVGEVASCDETTAAITRCAFKVYLVWGKKYRFALHLVKNPGHAGAASPDRGHSETEEWRKRWVF